MAAMIGWVIPSVVMPSPVTVVIVRAIIAIPWIIPRTVPSEANVPDEGIIETETAIACQTGRIGEITIVEPIVVSVGIAFVVACDIALYGLISRGYVKGITH